MSGENLDPLLQKPLSKACIRSCRSEKTVLNFFVNLFKIGSDTPLYYIQIINFTIYLIINPLTPLGLTAMLPEGDLFCLPFQRGNFNSRLPLFAKQRGGWGVSS